MTNSSPIQAVIFDMDGVLFLSTTCHEQAFQETLAPTAIRDFSYPSIAGMRTDEAFRKLFREADLALSQEQLENLVAAKRQRALFLLEKNGRIVEGGAALTARLKKRYRLALASSAAPQTVELFLRKSGYGEAFEIWLDGSSIKTAKPAPDIYLLALERLGLEASQCLVVEDSQSGVQAAAAAGLRVIAIDRTEQRSTLLRSGASQVISKLAEIEGLLEETAK